MGTRASRARRGQPRARRRTRGHLGAAAFTLLEVTIVMAVATILTTAGIVSATSIIQESRYRADRSRLFLDVRQTRDRGSVGVRGFMIQEVGNALVGAQPAYTQVRFFLSPICSPGDLTLPIGTAPGEVIKDYPAIDFAGDCAICYRGDTGQALQYGTCVGGDAFINFQPVGVAGNDEIRLQNDGRVRDNWKEFAQEGALEGSDCDVDQSPNCGL